MIKEVIVVEGVNDSKRLKEFFEVDTIETHGLGLKKETIEMIRKINESRGVILFLDPDTPGEKIRKRLNDAIPNLKNAFVFKQEARTKKKAGVEHATKEVLEEALFNLLTYGDFKDSISREQFQTLGLMGQENSDETREKVGREFHLGKCNAKTLLKRLNMMGITYPQVKEVIEDVKK